MKSLTAVLCLLTASASTASAFPDISIPYERHVLPNGFTLIIHEDHKAPVVAVNIWYHVGSKDERPGRTGFAHLFEHLMFNGSENHNDEYFRPIQAAGATKINGTTWLDRTNYFQNVPTSALDLTLWLESDRMGHLLGAIDQKKLDEQRGVVQNEKRQRENGPYGKADEVIAHSTYPQGHPYSWMTIGSMEDLNAASLEDVKDWFRTYYGAANAVLVIAGDVNPNEVQQKVEHYFGDIPSGPLVKRQTAWVARMSGERRASLQDRVPQAQIRKVWNIPPYRSRDTTLLDLAAQVLGQGKNSRLYKRLVYADQTATAVSAGVAPFEIGSQFHISVDAKPGADLAAVEKAIDEELARFLKTGPTAAEVERIKTANLAGVMRALERLDGFGGKSNILAESAILGGSPDFYKVSVQWTRDATPAQLQRVAKEWLSDGVFVLTIEPTPDYSVASTGADRSKLPATGEPPALKLPSLRRTRLSNGLQVVVAERHAAPVVDFNLIVDAGSAADVRSPGIARLALAMLDEGTKTRSALQIAERAESLGAGLGAGSNLDTSFIALNALSSKLPESLELFSDVLINATFPQADLERLRAQTLAGIQQEKTQPNGIAGRLVPRLVYGEGHSYANPASGTEASVRALEREELRDFVRTWIRPDNATLLVVGDTTLEQIKPLLEQHLGAWRAPSQPLPRKVLTAASLPQNPRVFLVNRTGAEQSTIVAGYPGPARSDPDYIALTTFNTILGGNFMSRLNLNLREDKRWAYGASSGLGKTKGPATFAASASVQTDKTAESMTEILKELRDIKAQRPPTDAELQFARASLVLGLPGKNETAQEVAGSYADVLTYGLADDYWNEYVADVGALTTADMERAAARLIQPEALTWLVVGDLAKIEAGVRALTLGEVKVLDTDGNVVR